MCQKIHGAAFGTYAFFNAGEVEWLSNIDTVLNYQSSEALERSACRNCGSVVPSADTSGENWIVPAGCHDDMPTPDYNIFVVDNSPWHTVSGDLPECDAYPADAGADSVEGIPAPREPAGDALHGSCLCGEITYRVTGGFSDSYICHCRRCRLALSAAHASNGTATARGLVFLTGEDKLRHYKLPEARYFTQAFCGVCSSAMPAKDDNRGISTVPLASLDENPGIKPDRHIFVADKARWHEITDGLCQHDEDAPSA